MPPRHTYWTIILEGKPTAFRAHTQEELLPSLRQLQSKHPDAVMMWFARGRLWKSEEESREAREGSRRPASGGERRGPAWRPGGDHEDPRARFKIPRDEKRRRFRERLFRDHSPDDTETPVGETPRPERPPREDRPPLSKDRPAPSGERRPWSKDRPAPSGERRPWSKDRPAPSGERRPWSKDRPAPSGERRPWQKKEGDRPQGPRRGPGRPPGKRGPRGGGGSSR